MQHRSGKGHSEIEAGGLEPGRHSLRRWFLVLTKPSAEGTAQQNLERQGYRVYYPRAVQPVCRRTRWIERIVSLFPRYLFVQLDAACQSLAPVRSTLGVANIVRFGAEATVVPDEIVSGIMGREDAGSGLHRLGSAPRFRPGVPVTVTGGVLEGLDGVFDREVGEERIVVLLNVLGRCTPVCVSSGHVALSGG